MSIRATCNGISKTSTGLARWCVDNGFPGMAMYCLTARDYIPLLDSSGAALELEGAAVTPDMIAANEQMLAPWYRDHAQAWVEQELPRREAMQFDPSRLKRVTRAELAALLPIFTPFMPCDVIIQDEYKYLPMFDDLVRCANALAYREPAIPEEVDCDEYDRVLWGDFAKCRPGNLAVSYCSITSSHGAHICSLSVTQDQGLVVIENNGDVLFVDVAGCRYGQRQNVQVTLNLF